MASRDDGTIGRFAHEMLIHLRRTDCETPAAVVGLALARSLGAWATGLHVVALAPTTYASPEAGTLYAGEADSLYRDALQCEPSWRAQLDAFGVAGEWQVAQGDPIEALCHASRWCDLVVVERPQLDRNTPTGWGIVSRTVFGASAPVVVVPERAPCATVGTHVVVAWNHSREAALAIRGAVPLLERADHVSVIDGAPNESPFGLRYLPKLDLHAWLARHGIAATFKTFKTGKESGAALLDAAHVAGADLIVMGAWGHSRITELVLGGTTRHLFQHSDLPLLVAH
jgi:nucleotide-binding universal stress UspA family protein